MNLDGLYITPRGHFRQENPQRVHKIPVIIVPTWTWTLWSIFWGFLRFWGLSRDPYGYPEAKKITGMVSR